MDINITELNSKDSEMKLLKSEHIDVFLDDKDDISTYLKRTHFNSEYT
nr:hypothetical protein [Sulfurimonas sp. MAG313]